MHVHTTRKDNEVENKVKEHLFQMLIVRSKKHSQRFHLIESQIRQNQLRFDQV